MGRTKLLASFAHRAVGTSKGRGLRQELSACEVKGGTDLSTPVGWDATHVVVHSREDRDWLLGHIDASEDSLGEMGDDVQARERDAQLRG